MFVRTWSVSALRFACTAALLTACAGNAAAVIIHNEGVNGDLSNDRLAPSPFFLVPGVSTIIATTGLPDREYVRLNIPAGSTLNAITLVSYVGNDRVGFIGVQAGTIMTESPSNPNPSNLLGWTHFGPDYDPALLADMSVNGMGFSPPLPSGDYTFWIQQLGSPATWQMDFVVIPAPSGVFTLGAFAAIPLRRRRA